jgi:hypothetical protein
VLYFLVKILFEPEALRNPERRRAFKHYVALRQAALGLIAILAVALMVEASGAPGNFQQDVDYQP